MSFQRLRNEEKKQMKVFVTVVLYITTARLNAVFSMNAQVKSSVAERIITSEEAAELTDVDCILVLSCQVKDDGTSNDMLKGRLTRSIEVYNLGAALIMRGKLQKKIEFLIIFIKILYLLCYFLWEQIILQHTK